MNSQPKETRQETGFFSITEEIPGPFLGKEIGGFRMRPENREIFVHPDELRIATLGQLEDVIKESKQELLEIRHQSEIHPTEKTHRAKVLKRLIARCKTIARENFM